LFFNSFFFVLFYIFWSFSIIFMRICTLDSLFLHLWKFVDDSQVFTNKLLLKILFLFSCNHYILHILRLYFSNWCNFSRFKLCHSDTVYYFWTLRPFRFYRYFQLRFITVASNFKSIAKFKLRLLFLFYWFVNWLLPLSLNDRSRCR
jgi:hypothetical protein